MAKISVFPFWWLSLSDGLTGDFFFFFQKKQKLYKDPKNVKNGIETKQSQNKEKYPILCLKNVNWHVQMTGNLELHEILGGDDYAVWAERDKVLWGS